MIELRVLQDLVQTAKTICTSPPASSPPCALSKGPGAGATSPLPAPAARGYELNGNPRELQTAFLHHLLAGGIAQATSQRSNSRSLLPHGRDLKPRGPLPQEQKGPVERHEDLLQRGRSDLPSRLSQLNGASAVVANRNVSSNSVNGSGRPFSPARASNLISSGNADSSAKSQSDSTGVTSSHLRLSTGPSLAADATVVAPAAVWSGAPHDGGALAAQPQSAQRFSSSVGQTPCSGALGNGNFFNKIDEGQASSHQNQLLASDGPALSARSGNSRSEAGCAGSSHSNLFYQLSNIMSSVGGAQASATEAPGLDFARAIETEKNAPQSALKVEPCGQGINRDGAARRDLQVGSLMNFMLLDPRFQPSQELPCRSNDRALRSPERLDDGDRDDYEDDEGDEEDESANSEVPQELHQRVSGEGIHTTPPPQQHSYDSAHIYTPSLSLDPPDPILSPALMVSSDATAKDHRLHFSRSGRVADEPHGVRGSTAKLTAVSPKALQDTNHIVQQYHNTHSLVGSEGGLACDTNALVGSSSLELEKPSNAGDAMQLSGHRVHQQPQPPSDQFALPYSEKRNAEGAVGGPVLGPAEHGFCPVIVKPDPMAEFDSNANLHSLMFAGNESRTGSSITNGSGVGLAPPLGFSSVFSMPQNSPSLSMTTATVGPFGNLTAAYDALMRVSREPGVAAPGIPFQLPEISSPDMDPYNGSSTGLDPKLYFTSPGLELHPGVTASAATSAPAMADVTVDPIETLSLFLGGSAGAGGSVVQTSGDDLANRFPSIVTSPVDAAALAVALTKTAAAAATQTPHLPSPPSSSPEAGSGDLALLHTGGQGAVCDAGTASGSESPSPHMAPSRPMEDAESTLPPHVTVADLFPSEYACFSTQQSPELLALSTLSKIRFPHLRFVSNKDFVLLSMPSCVVTKRGTLLPPLNSPLYLSHVVGVVWDKVHNSWVVTYTLRGRRHFHNFPAKRFGFLEARQRAIFLRLEKDREKVRLEGAVRGGGRRPQAPSVLPSNCSTAARKRKRGGSSPYGLVTDSARPEGAAGAGGIEDDIQSGSSSGAAAENGGGTSLSSESASPGSASLSGGFNNSESVPNPASTPLVSSAKRTPLVRELERHSRANPGDSAGQLSTESFLAVAGVSLGHTPPPTTPSVQRSEGPPNTAHQHYAELPHHQNGAEEDSLQNGADGCNNCVAYAQESTSADQRAIMGMYADPSSNALMQPNNHQPGSLPLMSSAGHQSNHHHAVI